MITKKNEAIWNGMRMIEKEKTKKLCRCYNLNLLNKHVEWIHESRTPPPP